MESKLLNVFYDSSYLPYKDSERTVHFPIGGGTFAGSQNTFRIRFYPKDLVGGNDYVAQTSWVLVSKLPNGKLGYELLSTIGTDSVLGEKYIQFDLSAYYTQAKGVVKLALRGYQGEVNFVEDEETGVYSVVGTPIIGVTGTIDIAINYSPMVYGEQLLPDELSKLVAKFSDYLSLVEWKDNFVKRIVVVDNTLNVDLGDYDYGQIFYDKSNSLYYIYDEDEGDLIRAGNGTGILNDEGYVLNLTNYYSSQMPYSEMFDFSGGNPFVYNHSGKYYLVAHYKNGIKHELFAKCLTDETYYSALLSATTYSNDDFEDLFNNQNLHRIATRQWVGDNYYEKSETYTQAQVDSAIASAISTLEQREFQKVNTTTYPTLNDFLASEGEEGYIYLYPIDTSDETKGFYQYIWENSAWLSLGTTVIDLSDYVQKTTSANKVYGTNELGGQTTYTVDDFYEGNIARRDTDGSITVPLTPTQNGHAASKKYVDDLTTLKTLNGVDLHGTGNISYDDELDSVSTNAVQNKVLNVELTTTKDELAQLKAIVYETTIEEDSFTEEHLQESALPLSVNSKSIVFSAGMDNTNIKGRSFVYNQIRANDKISGSASTATAYNNFGSTTAQLNYGHKYLVMFEVKTASDNVNTGNYSFKLGNPGFNEFRIGITNSSTWTLCSKVDTLSLLGTQPDQDNNIFFQNNSSTDKLSIEWRNMFICDLTQSGIDSATTVDEAIALLQQNGINPYEYNEYSTGKIIDSKPTALISHGFNVWDEEWEVGEYNNAGAKSDTGNGIRSKNKIRVLPNANYYFKGTATFYVCEYDINKTFIRRFQRSANNVQNFGENVYYITFNTASAYGTTYNHDICINLSNATLNGTYKPYIAPITYPLSLPVLRSAKTIQDNVSKVNVGTVDLGSLSWSYSSDSQCWYANLNLAKPIPYTGGSSVAHLLSVNYLPTSSNMWDDTSRINQISISNLLGLGYNAVICRNNSSTTTPSGTLNFELATPTDQPSITLPENITIEKGGSIEATYDSTAKTPSDFDFEVATYKPMEE